jgi:hypothetical protein
VTPLIVAAVVLVALGLALVLVWLDEDDDASPRGAASARDDDRADDDPLPRDSVPGEDDRALASRLPMRGTRPLRDERDARPERAPAWEATQRDHDAPDPAWLSSVPAQRAVRDL